MCFQSVYFVCILYMIVFFSFRRKIELLWRDVECIRLIFDEKNGKCIDGILETIDKHVRNQSRRFQFLGKMTKRGCDLLCLKRSSGILNFNVPLSGNMWEKRTSCHNKISIHRTRIYFFSQI